MRPLKALRNLVFFGCNMVLLYPLGSACRTDAGSLGFHHQSVLRHRIMTEDLTLEDPGLDADHAIGGVGFGFRVVDVRAQRVQRNATFAVPFDAGDFRTAETTAAGDLDAFGTKTQGGLHGALHRTTEGNAADQLVGNALVDELAVDF